MSIIKSLRVLFAFSVFILVASASIGSFFLLNYFIGLGASSLFGSSLHYLSNTLIGLVLFLSIYGVRAKINHEKTKVKNDTIITKSTSPIDWVNTIFLFLIIILFFTWLPYYLYTYEVNLKVAVASLIYTLLCGICITAGYHRYYCHRSFEAPKIIQYYFVIMGAANFQGPLSNWMSDHKNHHMFPETEKDPYPIYRGFWHAHMGWLIRRNYPELTSEVKEDKLIMWQHNYYGIIALITGLIIPTLIGYLLGSWVQGLLLGGIARTFYSEQTTFFINSLSHYSGNQQSSKHTTARNNLLMAILTGGEGNHNNHHSNPRDYRAGLKWYEPDITKLWIELMAKAGVLTNLQKRHSSTKAD